MLLALAGLRALIPLSTVVRSTGLLGLARLSRLLVPAGLPSLLIPVRLAGLLVLARLSRLPIPAGLTDLLIPARLAGLLVLARLSRLPIPAGLPSLLIPAGLAGLLVLARLSRSPVPAPLLAVVGPPWLTELVIVTLLHWLTRLPTVAWLVRSMIPVWGPVLLWPHDEIWLRRLLDILLVFVLNLMHTMITWLDGTCGVARLHRAVRDSAAVVTQLRLIGLLAVTRHRCLIRLRGVVQLTGLGRRAFTRRHSGRLRRDH